MIDCPLCQTRHSSWKECKSYQNLLKDAHGILSGALEKALDSFPEVCNDQARVDLANYCWGYLGVSIGPTIRG